jgi:CheY-like chemotaxis protein
MLRISYHLGYILEQQMESLGMKTSSFDQIKSLKILVVDDDMFALRVVRHILYGLGVGTIEEAFNGEGALEKLNKHNFDLLITDVEMPKLNGLELLKAIRCGATQAPRVLPIIIITGLTNSEVLGTSVSLDVNGFLAKPMKPVDVSAKVSSALNEIIATRPISDYESIETDLKSLRRKPKLSNGEVNASILIDPSEEEKRKAPQSPASQIEGDRVFIRELKPGMRVSQNLYLKDTSLLLKAGYCLSETTINRLVDLREMLAEESILVMPAEANEKN